MLVVEDDADVLDVLADVARMTGYDVTSVMHPDQVIDEALRVHPDLFLIDVMLPGMSGIDLAERLRSSRFHTTPMIAMSASAGMLQVAAQSGMFQDTLAKPFELVALLDAVERLVERAV